MISPRFTIVASLILLITVGAATGSGVISPTSPHPRDFTVTAIPNGLTIQPGQTRFSNLTIASIGGFSGTITLSATVSPASAGNATSPIVSVSPSSLRLKSGTNASSTLFVSTTASTQQGTYTVTILVQSSKITHTTTVTVRVASPADFTFTLQPNTETVGVGTSKTSFYNVASLNGFNGTITVAPTFPGGICNGNTTCNFGITTTPVSIGPGGNATGQITINAGTGTNPGTYNIVFTATSKTSANFHQATMTLMVTAAQPGDFAITATPCCLTITRGSTGFVNITLSSLGGFSGTVSLTGSVVPNIAGAPRVQIMPSSNFVSPNATAGSVLEIITNATTTLTQYNYTATGTSGSLSHTVVGEFTVVASSPPDFSIAPTPEAFVLTQGSSTRDFLNITSINGFSGTVTLSAAVSPSGPRLDFGGNTQTTTVTLSPGQMVQVVLAIFTNTTTPVPPGNYTITVTGTGGSITHAAQIFLQVTAATEALTLQSTSFQPLNVTLQISNAGSLSVSLVKYQILDGQGNNWTRTGWNGPTIPPGATMNIILQIGAQCPACTYRGTPGAFNQFTAGNTYTITLITSRSNGFQFSATFTSGQRESLNLESYSFTSGTNVTLFLRNTGNISISFVAYYVKDASGNQYALTSWSGPTINPNALGPAEILIGSSCPSCVVTGSAFTFTPGQAYTIVLVTARNNQFAFTVVR